MARVLTPQQFARDLRKQVAAFSPTKRRRFMRKVGGQTMTNMVLVRFARGGYEKPGDWKSNAYRSATQLDGRWSADYKVRPSGDKITADKIRLVDTAGLANSFRVVDSSANHVTVGPGKSGNYEKIAERAETERPAGWGNHIVGFTTEINDALAAEMQAYLDLVAEGREPPYLPKSRLGRKNVTL